MSESTGSRWIPLESNPEVFNRYAKKLGVLTSQDKFVDVYGLEDELLEIVPKPVKAVVLVFPIDKTSEEKKKQEDERIAKEGQPKIDPTIFWVKQTIPNACGTIGLIHALANSDVNFSPMSSLQKFIINARDKTPEERAKLLENTPLFATAHAESASEGQSATRAETDLHFTCFVHAPEVDFRRIADGDQAAPHPSELSESETGLRLIELDGRRNGPIDHGPCNDLLKDAITFIKSRYLPTVPGGSIEFNILALTGGEPL